jgi:hypothetical protein
LRVRTTHFPDRIRDSIAGRRCHDRTHFSDERSEHDSQQAPVRRSSASNFGTAAARSPAKPVDAGPTRRRREVRRAGRGLAPTPELGDAVRSQVGAPKDALTPWNAGYDYYNFVQTPAAADVVLPPPRISACRRSRRCTTPTRRSSRPTCWPAGGCMSTTEAAAAAVTPASAGRATREGEIDDEAARRRQGTIASAADGHLLTAGDDLVADRRFTNCRSV